MRKNVKNGENMLKRITIWYLVKIAFETCHKIHNCSECPFGINDKDCAVQQVIKVIQGRDVTDT